jgi:hypothetical protein
MDLRQVVKLARRRRWIQLISDLGAFVETELAVVK